MADKFFVGDGEQELMVVETELSDLLASVQITPNMLADLIVYAERYALGRRTYAVADVCRAIRTYKDCLSKKTRYVLIKDIESGIGAYSDGKFGADCDMKEWAEVLKELKEVTNNG